MGGTQAGRGEGEEVRESMSASASSGTVLYVEDEECDRMFMERAFQKAGMAHALRTVVNGQEAMDYLGGGGVYADRSQHPVPAVVLLDLNMPLVGGFDVLKWMRERPELTDLPVVIFSSSSKEEDRVRARGLGAKEFVEKPQTVGKFGEVVQQLREKWLAQG